MARRFADAELHEIPDHWYPPGDRKGRYRPEAFSQEGAGTPEGAGQREPEPTVNKRSTPFAVSDLAKPYDWMRWSSRTMQAPASAPPHQRVAARTHT